jgi:MurNAc alpha-1-phosphate uridylyltransferase
MKAMILAAGEGIRLRPLTDKIPKALVQVKGKPLLEHTINYLKHFGVDEIVINVHHFAGQIIDYLKDRHHGSLMINLHFF